MTNIVLSTNKKPKARSVDRGALAADVAPAVPKLPISYGATGNGSADDTAALQALLDAGAGETVYIDKPATYYRITGALRVAAGTLVTLHPQVIIEQMTHYKPVFDIYDADDVVIQVNGALLRYTGVRSYTAPASFRGSGAESYGAAIWCNGNRCKAYDVRASGFRSGVFLSGFVTASGAQVAYSKIGNEVHGLVVDTVDFGLVASGQVNPVIRAVQGSYLIEPPNGAPPHLIYFSDSAASKRLDIDGCIAHDGADSYAFQFKGCHGGTIRNLLADSCAGLLSLTDCSGLSIEARAVNDRGQGASGSLYMFGATSAIEVRDCSISLDFSVDPSVAEFQIARVAGGRNNVRIKARTYYPTDNGGQTILIYGSDNTITVNLSNLASDGSDLNTGRSAVAFAAAANRNRVTLERAWNFSTGFTVPTGALNNTIISDGTQTRKAAVNTAAFNTITDTTTAFERMGTQTFTVAGGGQYRPDATAFRTARLTVTDGTGFTFGGIYGTPPQGTPMTIIIDNQSGGAMGTINWSTVVLASTWANPATGSTKTVALVRDGAVWKEVGRSA